MQEVPGELIGAVKADHMDTIGHFRSPAADGPQPHYDWFASGSGFDLGACEKPWTQVATLIRAS